MCRTAQIATVAWGCFLWSAVSAPSQEPGGVPKPLPLTVVWGEAVNGWQLGVSLPSDNTSVVWGEPIRARVYLKNVYPNPREIQYGPIFSQNRFHLERIREWKTNAGREVRLHRETLPSPLTRYGRLLIKQDNIGPLKSAELKPGESLMQELLLSRCFDLSHGGVHLLTVERQVPHGDQIQVLKSPRVRMDIEHASPIPVTLD